MCFHPIFLNHGTISALECFVFCIPYLLLVISPLDEPIIVEDADEFMSATREIIDAWKTESRY